jgi:hypothetical protein
VPRTHEIASTTFDLPEPFGPTITLTSFEKSIIVFSEKDLNPLISNDFKYIYYPVVSYIVVKM